MKQRSGSTLVELITTLTVGGLLVIACAALVRSQTRLLRHNSERAAAGETLRAARTMLRAELQDLMPEDRRVVTTDSLALRVFRGFGIVCAVNAPLVTLRYQGIRQPDMTKDSLLVLGDERTGTILQISGMMAPCTIQTDERLVAIEPDSALAYGDVVLFFESGAYHLAGNALRYRRGPSGLQPMTDDQIDHVRSSFSLDSLGVLDLKLSTTATGLSYPLRSDSRIQPRNR